MYYYIEDDKLIETTPEKWVNKLDTVAVLSNTEWGEDTNIRTSFTHGQQVDKIHFCKLESYPKYLYGTIRNPIVFQNQKHIEFAYYILKERIIFIDDTGHVDNIIKSIKEKKLRKDYNLERFIYDFLVTIIEDDLTKLTEVDTEISKMEEDIFKGKVDKFNYRMLGLKKKISRLYRYYTQLIDVGEVLMQDDVDFFERDDKLNFHIFTDRVERLQGETQVLREYAMQVQEVYQSEIGIRQNDVMKVLTIVTTIFLPLTLIVGWYGMNFERMPELKWTYGYPAVAVVSVAILVISLWLFKKKKFF